MQNVVELRHEVALLHSSWLFTGRRLPRNHEEHRPGLCSRSTITLSIIIAIIFDNVNVVLPGMKFVLRERVGTPKPVDLVFKSNIEQITLLGTTAYSKFPTARLHVISSDRKPALVSIAKRHIDDKAFRNCDVTS